MVDRRLNDWNINPDPETLKFHQNQQNIVYSSTTHFARFIDDKLKTAKLVVDAGCGMGGPTTYLARNYAHVEFVGIDVSEALIEHAQSWHNLSFMVADLENLGEWSNDIDGVTCIAALSWMENYKTALDQISRKINPQWIAASTLIYEGNIDCRIVVAEYKRPRVSYYNIYALPQLDAFMHERGYARTKLEKFEIDIDLEKPANPDLMGTYTLQVASGGRIQCSGPLVLPWHFLMYERADDNTD